MAHQPSLSSIFQAQDAERSVVGQSAATVKNVGQVPNQLLWICPWRDRTRDSTLHQHRCWILSLYQTTPSASSVHPSLHWGRFHTLYLKVCSLRSLTLDASCLHVDYVFGAQTRLSWLYIFSVLQLNPSLSPFTQESIAVKPLSYVQS